MGAGPVSSARNLEDGGGEGSLLNSSHYLVAHYLAGTFNFPMGVGIITPHDEEVEARRNNYQGHVASK